MDDSLQPTIDMLLNLAVFMWFGAVCPWSLFLNNNVIPLYRLVFLGVLILLVRRLPIIFAMHKYIDQIENLFQTSFVGFFGPIGVGAIFYLSVSREYLHKITVDGKVREDAQQVSDAIEVIVWFLVICSIVSPILKKKRKEKKRKLIVYDRWCTVSPSPSQKQATTSPAPSPPQ
jgi:NhaP-type Na+/H+ or K+/H+ antiporter